MTFDKPFKRFTWHLFTSLHSLLPIPWVYITTTVKKTWCKVFKQLVFHNYNFPAEKTISFQSVCALKPWNGLPLHLKYSTYLSNFKSKSNAMIWSWSEVTIYFNIIDDELFLILLIIKLPLFPQFSNYEVLRCVAWNSKTHCQSMLKNPLSISYFPFCFHLSFFLRRGG